MLWNQSAFVLYIVIKKRLAFLLCVERKLDIAVVYLLNVDKASEHLLGNLGVHQIFSVQNQFSAIYLQDSLDRCWISLKARILWLFVTSVYKFGFLLIIIESLISVVKELFDSLFDDGHFFFLSSIQELLGHFDLNVKQWKVVLF